MIARARISPRAKFQKKFRHLYRYRWVYATLVPFFIYYALFKFGPLPYLRIIFQKYNPAMELLGVKSPWLEPLYKNFQIMFKHRDFIMLMKNTLILAGLSLLTFPIPVILALMMNEIRSMRYKKITQSILYLPHFISWVVFHSIVLMLLGPAPNGLVNSTLLAYGKSAVPFLESSQWFRPMYVIEGLWKEVGWSMIIYLAALAGVDEQLYEAAVIDGAGRFKQMLHITLPSIVSTIVVMLILKMGNFLDTGFDQIYLMLNALTRDVATTLDTYIYDVGIAAKYKPAAGVSTYSYSATIGIFKSVVGMVLIVITNRIANAVGGEGVY